MTTFKFRLGAVLKYREGVMDECNRKLKELQFERTRLISQGDQLEQRRNAIESDSRSQELKSGSDLRALSAFQLSCRKAIAELAVRIHDVDLQIATQSKLAMESKREFRLMEKLRLLQHDKWKKERDVEIEANAADSYLSKWNREGNF